MGGWAEVVVGRGRVGDEHGVGGVGGKLGVDLDESNTARHTKKETLRKSHLEHHNKIRLVWGNKSEYQE